MRGAQGCMRSHVWGGRLHRMHVKMRASPHRERSCECGLQLCIFKFIVGRASGRRFLTLGNAVPEVHVSLNAATDVVGIATGCCGAHRTHAWLGRWMRPIEVRHELRQCACALAAQRAGEVRRIVRKIRLFTIATAVRLALSGGSTSRPGDSTSANEPAISTAFSPPVAHGRL